MTLYNTTSDYRLKTVIAPVTDSGTRLDALQQKKLKLTTRVSDSNGVIAKIDQQNMSQKQRAQREKANAEKALKSVNTDIEREQGKMQETKLKLKTLIKKILHEMR